MMYLKWLLFLIPHVLIIANRYWLAWVAVKFFSTENKLQLKPGWEWFMTIDNPLSGDSGWQNEHITGDPLSDKNRIAWLRRNGGNSFNYNQLGVPEDKWFAITNWMVQDQDCLWTRNDGAWMLRGYFGPFYLFIGWSLFGAIEGRCKFTCTIKLKRKVA